MSLSFVCASQAIAEVKVTIAKTHLCCGACIRAVDKTLGEIKGVKHEASEADKTITLTADTVELAQKAVDSLAAAGFHGKLDNAQVKYKAVEAPEGKVSRLEITGIHNCCGACAKTIREAVRGVEGVSADTVKPKVNSFVIEGDFQASSAVQALLNAGFYVQVKK
jgi:copper chaperone CopZ